MEEKIRKYKGAMSKAQKIGFFEFCYKIFSHEIKRTSDGKSLTKYGFCNAYHYYFGEYSYDFNLIPELNKYRPKEFYDWQGCSIDDVDGFWFPPEDNINRVEISKKVLEDIKNG